MSWSIAIVVGLLNAVITAALAVGAGFYLMHALKLVDRDGGASMGIFFTVGPLALGVGLLFGLLGTWWEGAAEWSHLGRALALGAAVPNGVTLAFVAYQLASRPVVPRIDGRGLFLEVELFVPDGMIAEELLRSPESRASLYASDKDNRYLTVQHAQIRRSEGGWTVPLTGSLRTVSSRRMLSFTPHTSGALTLDMPLAARPVAADREWSAPMRLRRGILADDRYDYTEATARYRVVLAKAD